MLERKFSRESWTPESLFVPVTRGKMRKLWGTLTSPTNHMNERTVILGRVREYSIVAISMLPTDLGFSPSKGNHKRVYPSLLRNCTDSITESVIATRLILPVVICLFQRLSHARLSINSYEWNREWLIKSDVISWRSGQYMSYMDNCGNSRANTC